MMKHALGPMILAASILAVPVLAATQPGSTVSSSPAATDRATPPTDRATPPTNNMAAGMPGDHASKTAPAATDTAANQPATPTYTTSDDQVRLGKVVGASVYNDQNQSVGSVDDVLMSQDHKATAVVISVGGFLGIGSKLVSVPFDQLKIESNKIVMPGATKASLTGMPTYKYNNA